MASHAVGHVWELSQHFAAVAVSYQCRVQWGTMLAPFGKKSRARTTSAKSLGSKTAWPCFGRRLLAKDAKAMPRCGLGLNQLRIFFCRDFMVI